MGARRPSKHRCCNPFSLPVSSPCLWAMSWTWQRTPAYRERFAEAFGREPASFARNPGRRSGDRGIEPRRCDHVASGRSGTCCLRPHDSIGQFSRTGPLPPGRSFRPSARPPREGSAYFGERAAVTGCHAGPLLSDEGFHNTGVAWRTGALTDEGRAGVTGMAADRGAFKTPTLREVARTAPDMHDGSFATLEDVVEYHDRGGAQNPALDHRLQPTEPLPG